VKKARTASDLWGKNRGKETSAKEQYVPGAPEYGLTAESIEEGGTPRTRSGEHKPAKALTKGEKEFRGSPKEIT